MGRPHPGGQAQLRQRGRGGAGAGWYTRQLQHPPFPPTPGRTLRWATCFLRQPTSVPRCCCRLAWEPPSARATATPAQRRAAAHHVTPPDSSASPRLPPAPQLREDRITSYVEHPVHIEPPAEAPPPPPQPLKLTKRVGGGCRAGQGGGGGGQGFGRGLAAGSLRMAHADGAAVAPCRASRSPC